MRRLLLCLLAAFGRASAAGFTAGESVVLRHGKGGSFEAGIVLEAFADGTLSIRNDNQVYRAHNDEIYRLDADLVAHKAGCSGKWCVNDPVVIEGLDRPAWSWRVAGVYEDGTLYVWNGCGYADQMHAKDIARPKGCVASRWCVGQTIFLPGPAGQGILAAPKGKIVGVFPDRTLAVSDGEQIRRFDVKKKLQVEERRLLDSLEHRAESPSAEQAKDGITAEERFKVFYGGAQAPSR